MQDYRGIVTDDSGDVRGDPFGSRPADRSTDALAGLGTATRAAVVHAFFTCWPGQQGPLGLGRALADFQDWEISSARISDGGGSGWWAVVNGTLVADLADAGRSRQGGAPPPEGAGARAWTDYAALAEAEPASGAAQQTLWTAHQASIEAGAALAEPLLADETPAERRFAELVLMVVDEAARRGADTSTDELARLTRRHYPSTYPITTDALDALVRSLSEHRA